MVLVINELSYSEAVSENQAKVWYDMFFSICLKIEKDFKTKLSLKFSDNPNEKSLHSNFPFAKWLTSQNKEERSSILLMLTKETFIHDYPFYKAYDIEGKGFGYAYENDELLISFNTTENWSVDYLLVIQEELNETTSEIETEELKLRNCYDIQNCESHNAYISTKLLSAKNNSLEQINTGQDLWEKRIEIFPNLSFCESTEDFIIKSSGNIFKNLFNRFKGYEAYFSKWDTGDFDINAVGGDVRPESVTRIKDFNGQLTIKCPDNQNRLFSLHCNFGVYGFRLHFYPDTTTRKCIIGYIGKKIV